MTDDHTLRGGAPEPPGVSIVGGGINVAIWSAHATAIWFCLFDATGNREIARYRLPERTGDVHHGWIGGIGAGVRYGLRAEGPRAPGEGHRFNPAKLLVDPDAVLLDRAFHVAPSLFDRRAPGGMRDDADSAASVPKAIITRPRALPHGERPVVSPDRRIIYEVQVGGFTRRHPDVPARLRGTLAGLVEPGPLGHLVRLGVTTVELMPLAAWVDERHLPPLGLTNAWGYNPVVFGVPDPRVVPGGWDEVRLMSERLHAAGLEVILDVVLNHTGESDADGPTLSLRGLDNAGFYRLQEGDKSAYVNDTGCGNTLALERPHVIRLVMDCLRRWVQWGGIDGFRFDLATTMGRLDGGFSPAAPLLAAIGQDPVLRSATLIAEPWDLGPGGYRLGEFPGEFREWNDRFRDTVRRFWRGDAGIVGELATRFAGSSDLFAGHRPSRSVNFVTAHDGFTLHDLVSYCSKHNLANGEANRDGRDDNISWNHGLEGATDDPAIEGRRRQDQRNLLATLLLARGTPMLSMGAELGRTQGGNNNAYAQDNETTWVDWASPDEDLVRFAASLIKLRHDHVALHADRFLTGAPAEGDGLPDVAWLAASGEAMTDADWRDASRRTLVVRLYHSAGGGSRTGDGVLVVLHGGDERLEATLPPARDGMIWRRTVDTRWPGGLPPGYDGGSAVSIAARSVAVFVEEPAQSGTIRPTLATSDDIDRLARAMGIASQWWEISGRHTRVGDDTKRALLRAMGMACATRGDVREGLARIATETERRRLPRVHVGEPGGSVIMPITHEWGRSMPAHLTIVSEDGATQSVPVGVGEERVIAGIDGVSVLQSLVSLPRLDIGRYRVFDEARPEVDCHLIVAPRQCYLPRGLAEGARAFGVSGQLYGIPRAGDQGMGDLTTLGQLSEAAANAGAGVVGINPLHALFSGDRRRASPYFPSDRRFVDELYVDAVRLTEEFRSHAGARACEEWAHALEKVRASSLVDYPAVAEIKRAIIVAVFDEFEGRGSADASRVEFEAFAASGGEALADFALFEALAARQPGTPWRDWSEAERLPHRARAARTPTLDRDRRYALFVQWVADRQLAAAAERGRKAGLTYGIYRDVAVGVAPDGAETWAGEGLFAHGVSIGAPPDAFSETGQVWGLAPWSPSALVAAKLQPFRSLIAWNMRHAGMIRIDHILGLRRQFWVPDGARGSDGAYVDFPEADLHAELALASHRAGCVVVGEDLGTLPEGLRERLDIARILGTRVLPFERDGRTYRSPVEYPKLSVACATTHDLPPLAAWWTGSDISERLAIGLLGATAATAARTERAEDKAALLRALSDAGFETTPTDEMTPALAASIHAFLAESPSLFLIAQLEDLAGTLDITNVPGTDRERPNWRQRLDRDIDTLFTSDMAHRIFAALESRATRRGSF